MPPVKHPKNVDKGEAASTPTGTKLVQSIEHWLCYMNANDVIYAECINLDLSAATDKDTALRRLETETKHTHNNAINSSRSLSKHGVFLGFANKKLLTSEAGASPPRSEGRDVSLEYVVNICAKNLTESSSLPGLVEEEAPVLTCLKFNPKSKDSNSAYFLALVPFGHFL